MTDQTTLVLPVEESLQIPEGIHKGKIVDVVLRETEYKGKIVRYIDFSLTVDETVKKNGDAVTIKFGCPAQITVNTKLGKTLMDLGIEFHELEEFDVRQVMNTSVQYQTTNKEVVGKGTFADVLDGTLKKV